MKICTRDGCDKKHLARGLCSTHYNQAFQPNRHPAKRAVECAECGKSCQKAPDPRRPRQYCSLACRDAKRRKRPKVGTQLVHVGPAWPRSGIPPQHPCRRRARVWRGQWDRLIAGNCSWCTADFVGIGSTSRYCSDRCSRAAAKRRRGHFAIPADTRTAIYERDGWVCQLCKEPVDRDLGPSDVWGATLDHIKCQSWGTPDHSPENLRLAHRWCNSVRGDERYYTADVLAA